MLGQIVIMTAKGQDVIQCHLGYETVLLLFCWKMIWYATKKIVTFS
jgi:hypothetical protein